MKVRRTVGEDNKKHKNGGSKKPQCHAERTHRATKEDKRGARTNRKPPGQRTRGLSRRGGSEQHSIGEEEPKCAKKNKNGTFGTFPRGPACSKTTKTARSGRSGQHTVGEGEPMSKREVKNGTFENKPRGTKRA